MLRRVFLSCSGIGMAALLCGGCFLKASVPKGWRRISLSNVAFNVPQNWKQVEIPDSANLIGWDWAMQDTSAYDDGSASCRLLVMTHGVNSLFKNPPKNDTKLLATYLSQTELFGEGTADGPYKIKGIPDQLWKLEYKGTSEGNSSSGASDSVFVAQDEGESEIAVVGLTGPGITQDILDRFSASIEVLHA